MFIDYKVTSTRRLFLSEGTDIEMVKKALAEDPSTFINDTADRLGIVENDEYLYESERMVLDGDESTIELYDCDEDEATSPDWHNKIGTYRPFKQGDVLEEGDQFRYTENDEWKNLTNPSGPIDGSIIGSTTFRKLIK